MRERPGLRLYLSNRGIKIIELHRTWAVIDDPVNRSPRTFYRRNIAPEQTTLPWMLELSPLMRTG